MGNCMNRIACPEEAEAVAQNLAIPPDRPGTDWEKTPAFLTAALTQRGVRL